MTDIDDAYIKRLERTAVRYKERIVELEATVAKLTKKNKRRRREAVNLRKKIITLARG